ncbi:MAG: hypothetical protein IGQ88_09285 [Gloeomargaritaceae cyanobacterium C42_A2020_066]|nr:hypothetical protein [Gloeomargaritaceae cyanobacterium C42_A2020_066]
MDNIDSRLNSTAPALAKLWAQKYVKGLAHYAWETTASPARGPDDTAAHLLEILRFASSQAWSKTESLLSQEIQRHRIAPSLIDPWRIANDSRRLFEKAAENYSKQVDPQVFSGNIAADCNQIRDHYTERDPRVLGFMSMQFHYTGQILLEQVGPEERRVLSNYLKVMDDHLYMPLGRCYRAAAQHDYDDPVLQATREILPQTTEVAESICAEVAQRFQGYECQHGSLDNLEIRVSSVRDTEMFQVYLALCLLEGDLRAVQQELFPLCVMLYPPLKVHWGLVRTLLTLLEQKLPYHLTSVNYELCLPVLRGFQDMFSPDVLPDDDPTWNQHPDTVRYMSAAQSLLKELTGS